MKMLNIHCPVCGDEGPLPVDIFNHDVVKPRIDAGISCDICKSIIKFQITNADHIKEYLNKIEDHPDKVGIQLRHH